MVLLLVVIMMMLVLQGLSNAPVRLSVGLPSGVSSYAVYDNTGKAVVAQLLPPSPVDAHLRTEYYNYTSSTPVSWLVFTAANVSAVGYTTYFVIPAASAEEAPLTHVSVPQVMAVGAGPSLRSARKKASSSASVSDGLFGDQVLTNGIVSLTISGATGRVSAFANAVTGVRTQLVQVSGGGRSSQRVVCRALAHSLCLSPTAHHHHHHYGRPSICTGCRTSRTTAHPRASRAPTSRPPAPTSSGEWWRSSRTSS